VFCREHAMQLHRDREKFEAAGVNLAVIGQGTLKHAKHFKEQQHVEDLLLLVDPDRKTYKTAGAKKGTVGELVGPGVVARGIRTSLRSRVVQSRPVGHPAQLGGVLVVATDGRVTWAHLARDASDNPPNEEVLEAAREAAGTSVGDS
jgi:AhpC/TSA antioxidant enzyme